MRRFVTIAVQASCLCSLATHAFAGGLCASPRDATGVAYQTSVVAASDGTCLRGFSWRPAGQARAVVVITHGIRDYALRYDAFARQLTAQGYAVFAQDLRGHAHSGGDRQRFDSMQQLVGDTDLAVTDARRQFPDLPLFMYGHSLGGLVTTSYVIAHQEKVSGAVLSGAALMRPQSVGALSVVLARLVAAVAPGFKAVAVDDSQFSRDPAVTSALASDALVDHGKLPAISAVASVDGMQQVRERASSIRIPLLVMYGTADSVNPVAGSDALFESVASEDKSIKPYQGLYHDMLNEPERAQVTADVIAWLNARL